MEGLLILAALCVAFSNGANDNFKGVATVWGSQLLSYREALLLATVATVAGSGKRLHVLSAATICFARGVNDTPKLVALLLVAKMLDASMSVPIVAATMALGGFVFARRVAEKMSLKMTRLDDHQGLVANLITAGVVLFASKLGLPVSTTHVSVGAIAGVGAGARTIDWATVRGIALSWVATLPVAAAIALVAALVLRVLRA